MINLVNILYAPKDRSMFRKLIKALRGTPTSNSDEKPHAKRIRDGDTVDLSSIDSSKLTTELFDALFPNPNLGFKCVHCNHTKYQAGPQGGLAQNIRCANKDCHYEYNICLFDGTSGLAHEIG